MRNEYSLALAVGNLDRPLYKLGITFPKKDARVFEVEARAHHIGHLEKDFCISKIKFDGEANILYIRTLVEENKYLFTKLNISSVDEAGKYHGKSVERPVRGNLLDKIELGDKDYELFLSTRAYFWEN